MGIRAWILLATMMALIVAPPSSKACSCIYFHPQSFVCNMDIVIKGQFLNVSEWNSSTDPSFTFKGYNIKVEKVFKGNISQNILFVDRLAGTSCEFKQVPGNFYKDYLITVSKGTNTLYINSCSFIGLWSQLSSTQIKGFQGGYAKECHCKVTPCFLPPCLITEKECDFNQKVESVRQDQEQNKICAQNKEGRCTWADVE